MTEPEALARAREITESVLLVRSGSYITNRHHFERAIAAELRKESERAEAAEKRAAALEKTLRTESGYYSEATKALVDARNAAELHAVSLGQKAAALELALKQALSALVDYQGGECPSIYKDSDCAGPCIQCLIQKALRGHSGALAEKETQR